MSRFPTKFVDSLSNSDREFLEQVWRQHQVYTVRCRAHAILLSDRGFAVTELQAVFDIAKPTALAWIDRWQERGRDGLEDEPRPGGPPIVDENEQQMFIEEMENHPHQPRKVHEAIERRTGKTVSRDVLRRLARKLGFRWKRLRRSLADEPNPREFHIAREEIEQLQAEPDVTVAFFDEAAFSLQGVVPYGWQRVGERQEVSIGASRGSVQVLGIEEQDGETYGYLHKGSVKGTTVLDVLDDYSLRITQHTILVLDNASVHTCRKIEEQLSIWNERGLYLYFLPPHSPELNNIERLWDDLKHRELPLDAWKSFRSLVDNLTNTFKSMGEAIVMPSLQC